MLKLHEVFYWSNGADCAFAHVRTPALGQLFWLLLIFKVSRAYCSTLKKSYQVLNNVPCNMRFMYIPLCTTIQGLFRYSYWHPNYRYIFRTELLYYFIGIPVYICCTCMCQQLSLSEPHWFCISDRFFFMFQAPTGLNLPYISISCHTHGLFLPSTINSRPAHPPPPTPGARRPT